MGLYTSSLDSLIVEFECYLIKEKMLHMLARDFFFPILGNFETFAFVYLHKLMCYMKNSNYFNWKIIQLNSIRY